MIPAYATKSSAPAALLFHMHIENECRRKYSGTSKLNACFKLIACFKPIP